MLRSCPRDSDFVGLRWGPNMNMFYKALQIILIESQRFVLRAVVLQYLRASASLGKRLKTQTSGPHPVAGW